MEWSALPRLEVQKKLRTHNGVLQDLKSKKEIGLRKNLSSGGVFRKVKKRAGGGSMNGGLPGKRE